VLQGPGGPSPWRNPQVLLILFLVFLSGAASGVVGMRLAQRPVAAKSMPYWKEGGKEISLQRFRKELDLTDAQAAEIEVILDDFMMYYQTLQAQIDEVRAHGKERIQRILNEKQRDKFSRMLSDLQAKQLK
jgi:uncharacterized membrane protein